MSLVTVKKMWYHGFIIISHDREEKNMRFIHLADLHLGKTLHGVSLLDSGDQSYWVDGFLRLCGEIRPDAVVIAGDVYDRSAPAAGAVALLSRLLTELTALGICVLVIPGNHDSAPRLAFGRELLAPAGLHIAPPLSAPGTLTRVTLADSSGPVDFWLMPYLFPALVSEALGTELRDYDGAIRALLAAQPLDLSRRNVLIAHQNVTVGGTEAERGGSESMVGGIGQVDYTAFDGFDYVALGHIHAGYAVGRAAVRYAGSPLCYHFHETTQARKGPLLVELGPKGTPVTTTLLPLPPLHPMQMVTGSFDEVRAAMAAQTEEGQYLSITLTDQRVTPAISDELYSLCAARNSLVMELTSQFQTVHGTAELTTSALRQKGLAELFADFCIQRSGGTEPNEAELAVLHRAATLAENADTALEPTPEQIEQVLREAGRGADT